MTDLLLAVDVGATKADLALYRPEDLTVLREETLISADYRGAAELIRTFLKKAKVHPIAVGLALPGPCDKGVCKVTNLPWVVRAEELAEELAVDRVELLNDLAAMAWGVEALGPADLVTINRGIPDRPGNAALVAAGTGLGEAILFWDGARLIPSGCEGGHTDFGPTNETERELLVFLEAELGRVSYERIASGLGLPNIYRFFRDAKGLVEPGRLAEEMKSGDPGAVIVSRGLSGESELCRCSLELFLRVYGAEAGNLALKANARGGVYIGGGIAPRLIDNLARPEGPFLQGYRNKGRMSDLVSGFPVKVITYPKPARLGAARRARLLSRS